ncbi:MAG: YkgJ family cysteine cluster protein [Novosphingobium sp.]
MSCSGADLSTASRLCLACGMCCDGTVYNVGRLDAAEVAQAAATGFRALNAGPGTHAFAFPCSHLDGKACSIYRQWRPTVCSTYFCSLQVKVAAGEIAEEQALSTIAATLAVRDQVRTAMRSGESLAHARDRFETTVRAGQPLDPQDGKALVKLFVLEKLLDRHFRKAGEERLREVAQASPAMAEVNRR